MQYHLCTTLWNIGHLFRFTGFVFLCNETRNATTVDKIAYAYD